MPVRGYVKMMCACGPVDGTIDVRDVVDAVEGGEHRLFVPIEAANP